MATKLEKESRKRELNDDVFMSPSKRRKQNINALWEQCEAVKKDPLGNEQPAKTRKIMEQAAAILSSVEEAPLSFARCHGILADCSFLLHDVQTWEKHSNLLVKKLESLKRPRHQVWLLEVKAREALFYGRYLEVVKLCTKSWKKIQKRYFLEDSEKPEQLDFYHGCALVQLKNPQAEAVIQKLLEYTSCEYLKSQCFRQLATFYLAMHDFKKVRENFKLIDNKYLGASETLETELKIAESEENWDDIERLAYELYKFDSHREKAQWILRKLHQHKLCDEIVVVDSSQYGNLARFIEHSDCPNCEIKAISSSSDAALPRLGVYVIKMIEPGEQLTSSFPECTETNLPKSWKNIDKVFPEMDAFEFMLLKKQLGEDSSTSNIPVKVKDGKLYAVDTIPKSARLFMRYTGIVKVVSRSCEYLPTSVLRESKSLESVENMHS